ncbi:MAG: tetratricopeptide repeat protein [Bacteroidales bacterium]
MERKKYFIGLIVFILSLSGAKAGYREIIYGSYISSDMALWKRTIDAMHLKQGKNNEFILELVNYQYGYIGWCLGQKRDDEAESYLELAEDYLDALEAKSFKPSYTHAYRSAFYGYRIGLSIWIAPVIGPKSIEEANQAMKLDSRNPFGFIQYGNAQYHMPAMFGGSKSHAIDYFKLAEKKMEAQMTLYAGDWNYLSLLAMIGKAYEDTGDYRAARTYYEKALKEEPNFLWVKNQLYPNILKKIK